MRPTSTIWLAVFAIVTTFLSVGNAHAQDCGDNCEDCGFFGKEGVDYNPTGKWHMDCDNWTAYCSQQYCGGMVNDQRPLARDLALTLSRLPASDLTAFAIAHSDRLLIIPGRRMVAVRGVGCDMNAVGAVVTLEDLKWRLLKTAGVLTTEDAQLDNPARLGAVASTHSRAP